MPRSTITTDDLLFVSFNGKVFALDRADGEVVWKWKAPNSHGVVMMLPDGDRLFVSASGYTWALDPTNGAELWYQPFKGEGIGIPMLGTMRSGTDPSQAAAAAALAAIAATDASTHGGD